jgi:hypothetical protein
MIKKAIILSALLACNAFATSEWRPSTALLQAVRQVESNNGQLVYGDKGRSLGPYQLSRAAWTDISAWRRARGEKVYSYGQYAMHDYINQVYAADYLTMIHGELSRQLRRAPTAGEIYAAYNMGLAHFADCDYRLARVNPVTAQKCRAIHALIERAG